MSGPLKRAIQLILLLGLIPASQTFLAAETIFIRDIQDNPQKYYNLQVEIQGEVIQVTTPPNPTSRGHYVVMDNSDKTIKIIANTLPVPNRKLLVRGIVQVDTTQQEPYLREVIRENLDGSSLPSGFVNAVKNNPVIVTLVVLIIITVIALIVVILRKPAPAPDMRHQGRPTMPVRTAHGTPPAPEEKTRMVSRGEVEKHAGGLKTKQVPSPLAELRILTGKYTGKAHHLTYETPIGRTTGDIILQDPSVSRKHAVIFFANGEYIIENKSGTNPVIVNSSQVASQKALKDGDEIILGVIKLQFKLI